MEQKYFAACHVDDVVVRNSSSGGAFTAITDLWFVKHGERAVVYGCVMDQDLEARHIRATGPQDRNRMRGSKYIGSNMSGVFRLVEEDLHADRYVLFSGTPCQIGGLLAYLKAKKIDFEEYLLTLEVICHGVASVRFFQDYVRKLEKKHKSKAVACSFRAKSRPGKKQDMQVRFQDGSIFQASSTKYDWFYNGYLRNYVMRPSCYRCRYACRERVADISIADHWGDRKGEVASRSLIVVNTEYGFRWVLAAGDTMELEAIPWEQIRQPHMQNPCEKPEDYENFWKCYRESGYFAAQKVLGNHTVKGHVRAFVVELLFRLHLIELGKAMSAYLLKIRGRR